MNLLKKWRDKIEAWLKKQQAHLPSIPSVPTIPGQWPQACANIKAAMVTPMFVYADGKQVASQCDALRGGGYNAVASLVDLQAGRSYIVEGRTATALTAKCRANVESCLDAGLTPVLILRNDWAVRTKCKTVIPSIGGPAPADAASFYSSAMLAQEKAFIDSLKDLFPYIHIQLSIECQPRESADFALMLAEYLRNAGFTNQILVNPYAEAVEAHEGIRSLLDKLHVRWARSRVGTVAPSDPVWNTDGDQSVTAATAKTRIDILNASQKDWILWGVELKDCPNGIPEGYLVKQAGTPSTGQPSGQNAMTEAEAKAYAKTIPLLEGAKSDDPKVIAMLMRWGKKISHFGGGATPTTPYDETNLWKPKSDSDGKLVVILAHSCNCESVSVNGEKVSTRSIGNGFRHHFRFSKQGAAYGNATIIVEGAGTAQIVNGGARQSFKVSGSATPASAEPTTPSEVSDDSESFSWMPAGDKVLVTVPKSYKAWQAHVFGLRKHQTIWGPVRGSGPFVVTMSPAQITEVAKALGESNGAVMFYVNTSTSINGGGNQAGWRIFDAAKEVRGNATQLKTGEDK